MAKTYLQRAEEKRAKQLSLIPPEWRLQAVPGVEEVPNALDYIRHSSLLSVKELEITETTDANVLLRQLAKGELTSLETITAFAKRASLATQLTTCCSEIFISHALEDAKRLDSIFAATGKPVGPLHGLPVSLKDVINVKGKDSTVGWVGLIDKPAAKDANIAAILRKLGAVLYVKTNVPQSMMMSDSYNHVFGQTVSSLNRRLISGGSSGGESSLIAARGSILGIGTDIGGSIRIPAALCNLYGLLPSLGRQPHERGGLRQRIVCSIAGPIASNLSTIETYMQHLSETNPWELDPLVVPIPWDMGKCTLSPNTKLRVGFIIDDGIVKPQPPISRAVTEVISALQSVGHEVIEWDASTHGYAYDLWEKAILSDGGAGCKKLCEVSGEPLIKGMLVGKEENILSTEQLHQLLAEKYEYEREYLRIWKNASLDALIMPVVPWVGYKPWTWVNSNQYVGYTSIWNLLDWACLNFPVTTASKLKDGELPEEWVKHQGRNKADIFNKKQFDIDLIDGAPIGLQVVCGKYQDEKCIAVAKLIEDLLSVQ